MHRSTWPTFATFATFAAVLTAVLLTAACGTQDGGGTAASDSSAPGHDAGTGSPPSTPSSSATPPTTPPTTPPSGQLAKVRVVGEVIGTGDCVVVRDDNQITWTITGPKASSLVLHDRVQVTGTPDLRALGCGGPVVQAVVTTVLPPAG